MQVSVALDIQASPEQVWAVLRDVERWTEWSRHLTVAAKKAAGHGTRYSIVAEVQLKGVVRVLGPIVTPIVNARLNRL